MPAAEFLSDSPELFLNASQAWGQLGFDVAAHQTGVAGLPLRVGTNNYNKGLGHHANGTITVSLDSAYLSFDAEVGVQKQASDAGTVVFRVMVDGDGADHGGCEQRECFQEILRGALCARLARASVDGGRSRGKL